MRATWTNQLAKGRGGIDPEDESQLLTFKTLPSTMSVAAIETVKQAFPNHTSDDILSLIQK